MANSERRIANSKESKRPRRLAFYSLFAIRYSLFAAFLLAGASTAGAVECAPYCDFTHDYGPYDLTYKRPGLYAFPRCGPSGDCSPRAVYSYPRRGVRITVRPRRRQ
jgi:hypothetical protein